MMNADKIHYDKIKTAFLKTLDRSIDAIGNDALVECFGDELSSAFALEGDFIAAFGHAKLSMEVCAYIF